MPATPLLRLGLGADYITSCRVFSVEVWYLLRAPCLPLSLTIIVRLSRLVAFACCGEGFMSPFVLVSHIRRPSTVLSSP
jgi:hypothetical protein